MSKRCLVTLFDGCKPRNHYSLATECVIVLTLFLYIVFSFLLQVLISFFSFFRSFFVLFVSCIQYDDGEDCDISNENQLLHYFNIYKKLNPNFFSIVCFVALDHSTIYKELNWKLAFNYAIYFSISIWPLHNSTDEVAEWLRRWTANFPTKNLANYVLN